MLAVALVVVLAAPAAIGVGAGSISWLKFAASTRENGVHYAKRKVINIMGGDVEIVEAGALDGLDRERIAALAPEGDDEILVARRAAGFDAHVAPLSLYQEHDPAAVRRAAQPLRAGSVGLVVMDCIGFRRKTRDEMAALTGAPTLVANLLVARVAAELLGR
jgi:hypothetical protein